MTKGKGVSSVCERIEIMNQAPESPYFLKINSLSSRSQRIKDFALAAIQIAS